MILEEKRNWKVENDIKIYTQNGLIISINAWMINVLPNHLNDRLFETENKYINSDTYQTYKEMKSN